MPADDRRTANLDALERRLTGPKRIGLFGHRAVGKTTLLAMFYREASTGRVPGARLAAADAPSAEYLAEKIAQIEAGEPPAGTLAETELALRLYRGPARLDLIVKDYQGELVGLGSEAAILREFFADCDAVLLCVDPEAGAGTDRRRRQQEVERLLERYFEASDDATAGRPVALVVTKYDRVLAAGGPPPDRVADLVADRFGMTGHALATHAPRSAIFAVSSYGRDATADGRPPVELHPSGLEGPLGWLVDELEAADADRLDWLWDLAPDDRRRLSRCVRAFERRYPRSGRLIDDRRRLRALGRKRLRRRLAVAALGLAGLVGALAAYDTVDYRRALAYERDHSAPAVARRWQGFLATHPLQPLFWPAEAKSARLRAADWAVRGAQVRAASGSASPEAIRAELAAIRDEAPHLAPPILQVENTLDRRRHDEAWAALLADDRADDRPAEDRLSALRRFLREFPDSPHLAEARRRVDSLATQVADRQAEADRRALEDVRRAADLPDADLRDLIDRARSLVEARAESPYRPELAAMLDDLVARLDARDIARARDYSREHPSHFQVRIDRYREYLDVHRDGGRYVGEAAAAIAAVERQRDSYQYRLAHDHLRSHPDDLAEVARRFRDYLAANPNGRFVADARRYLDWWSRVERPGTYKVTLRRGAVDKSVGKYLGGGGPDLCVEFYVAGRKYGPSPVVPNSHRPVWEFSFPAVAWKVGDPVVVRILDRDWSDSEVFTLKSAPGDPLAIRNLSGTIRPAKGGPTELVFASDFAMPTLAKPD